MQSAEARSSDPHSRLCVVVPCYNESDVVERFYADLKRALESLEGIDHRVLLVDDGSTDDTLEKANRLAEEDPRLLVYSLSRNFGHQVALTAGLDAAEGDAVLMMDADLQHPPELISPMVELWLKGNDVVSAVRRSTAHASLWRRLSSRLFYGLVNRLSDTPVVPGAADFCLLSRRAHQALLRMPERHRFLRGLVSWIGFERAYVYYEAPARAAGTSKYGMAKMIGLALDATLSFSALPLRLATRVGVLIGLLGTGYLAYILVHALLFGGLVAGWASLISVVLILGGAQLVFIGLVGQYLSRVFEETKQRPLYLLKQAPPGPRGEDPPRGRRRPSPPPA